MNEEETSVFTDIFIDSMFDALESNSHFEEIIKQSGVKIKNVETKCDIFQTFNGDYSMIVLTTTIDTRKEN